MLRRYKLKTLLKGLLGVASLVPLSVRRAKGVAALWAFYFLSARYRLITRHNLARAFPEKTEKERRRIAWGAYKNVGLIVGEYLDLPFVTKETIRARVGLQGEEHYWRAKEKGRGVIVMASHFGNWELQVVSLPLLVEPIAVVYRPLDNPLLEEITSLVRTGTGNRLIGKRGAFKECIQILERGESFGIVIDQNMSWQTGVFVDFFGRPACTAKSLATLARATGAAVVPSFMVRNKGGDYTLLFLPAVEPARSGDEGADIIADTQKFTRIVEDMVRRYPEQWLWLHQRWKTKPCQVGR
jgi:KDO2-lipid IV(A) lauroyltransferase